MSLHLMGPQFSHLFIGGTGLYEIYPSSESLRVAYTLI